MHGNPCPASAHPSGCRAPAQVGTTRKEALHQHRQARLNDNSAMTSPEQPRNPLHGITLERMVTELVDYFGWAELGDRIPVRCFNLDPSVTSSLRFLRKTPWAREKVEGLYLFMLREQKRSGGAQA